jgi:hypothetical protein
MSAGADELLGGRASRRTGGAGVDGEFPST